MCGVAIADIVRDIMHFVLLLSHALAINNYSPGLTGYFFGAEICGCFWKSRRRHVPDIMHFASTSGHDRPTVHQRRIAMIAGAARVFAPAVGLRRFCDDALEQTTIHRHRASK